MIKDNARFLSLALAVFPLAACSQQQTESLEEPQQQDQAAAPAEPGEPFHLIEATIHGVHAEMRAGRLTCVELVRAYLDRIAAYDQTGPTLNAVQNIHPRALEIAAERDADFIQTGDFTGRLHCIPVLVKDSVNTNYMPTTFGSALYKDFIPSDNATVVERLEAAGAIILAKTNMGEYARSYSGSAFGDCHNAYDPGRSPSGSSCGTGVGIAANFGMVGIGEDTNGSIRGPAAHGALVGLRPTLQLVSRAGMMPFDPTRDTLGPIARTVRDAAIVLDAIAGYDPRDPATAYSYGKVPDTYTSYLVENGLQGMRFGVIRVPMSDTTDPTTPDYAEIQAAITQAVEDMRGRGAEVIDPLDIPNLMAMIDAAGGGGDAETALNAYLAQYPDAPAKTLAEIVASPLVSERRREQLVDEVGAGEEGVADSGATAREELRTTILKVMADHRLDALLYATYDHAPTPVPVSTPGTNRLVSPATGFPAIAFPGGYFADGMPLGLELMARPFDEGLLLKAVYDYEQATRHRRPPATTPALPGEP